MSTTIPTISAAQLSVGQLVHFAQQLERQGEYWKAAKALYQIADDRLTEKERNERYRAFKNLRNKQLIKNLNL